MNVKLFSTIAALALLVSTTAHAEIGLGCKSKGKLQAELKENHQSFIEQFERETANGKVKTSVTSEHLNSSYTDKGKGYIIESRGEEGCVVAKTRLDFGSTPSQFSVSTVHSFAGKDYTAAEWRKLADYAKSNRSELESQWKKEGYSEPKIADTLKALDIIAKHGGLPDEVSTTLQYELKDGLPHAVSRGAF